MPWERLLDNIREGKIQICDIGENGVPRLMTGAPHYELMQFVAAVVSGYNRNYLKIKSLKNMVRKETED